MQKPIARVLAVALPLLFAAAALIAHFTGLGNVATGAFAITAGVLAITLTLCSCSRKASKKELSLAEAPKPGHTKTPEQLCREANKMSATPTEAEKARWNADIAASLKEHGFLVMRPVFVHAYVADFGGIDPEIWGEHILAEIARDGLSSYQEIFKKYGRDILTPNTGKALQTFLAARCREELVSLPAGQWNGFRHLRTQSNHPLSREEWASLLNDKITEEMTLEEASGYLTFFYDVQGPLKEKMVRKCVACAEKDPETAYRIIDCFNLHFRDCFSSRDNQAIFEASWRAFQTELNEANLADFQFLIMRVATKQREMAFLKDPEKRAFWNQKANELITRFGEDSVREGLEQKHLNAIDYFRPAA